MSVASNKKVQVLRVLLGALILWQIWYLVSSNFAFLLGKSQARQVMDDIDTHWAQATGMWQGWAQFSGNMVRQAAFPLIELRWREDDRRVMLSAKAAIEPQDPEHFFRLPVHARLGTYEDKFVLPFLIWNSTRIAEDPAGYRRGVSAHLRVVQVPLRRYLQWRLDEYLTNNRSAGTPTEIILWVRVHRTPEHDQVPWQRQPAEVLPVARWQPGVPVRSGLLPIEVYDPDSRTFASVVEKEQGE
jgi:hypothetical protein